MVQMMVDMMVHMTILFLSRGAVLLCTSTIQGVRLTVSLMDFGGGGCGLSRVSRLSYLMYVLDTA